MIPSTHSMYFTCFINAIHEKWFRNNKKWLKTPKKNYVEKKKHKMYSNQIKNAFKIIIVIGCEFGSRDTHGIPILVLLPLIYSYKSADESQKSKSNANHLKKNSI